MNSLEKITVNENKHTENRRDASSLKNKMAKFEIAFMAALWNKILTKFNNVCIYF